MNASDFTPVRRESSQLQLPTVNLSDAELAGIAGGDTLPKGCRPAGTTKQGYQVYICPK